MRVTSWLSAFLRRESTSSLGWLSPYRGLLPPILCCPVHGHQPHWPLCSSAMPSWLTFAPLHFWLGAHIHDVLKLVIQAWLKCQLLRKDFPHHPNAIFSLCQLNPFHLLSRLFTVWNFLAHALVYLYFSVYNSYTISFRRAEILSVWLLLGLLSWPAPYSFPWGVGMKGLILSLLGMGCFGVTKIRVWAQRNYMRADLIWRARIVCWAMRADAMLNISIVLQSSTKQLFCRLSKLK